MLAGLAGVVVLTYAGAAVLGDGALLGGVRVGSPTLLAAGDIAECGIRGDEATAKILAEYPQATIATLGDNAYQHGTLQEFKRCYGPSWGRFKGRTRPAVGNHDHSTKDAAGFHAYFGAAGGPFDKYYYSYDLGSWHVVVLNSDCWRVGGCDRDDPQVRWLRRDLFRHPTRCTLAYWHRPPFSSGRYGKPVSTSLARPMWRAFHVLGGDVLLTGHEHNYERFAPMDAEGRPDEYGTRLFVVGTGGGNLRGFKYPPLPTTEVRNGRTWGVLKLRLHDTGYDWEFEAVAGESFHDSGSDSCN